MELYNQLKTEMIQAMKEQSTLKLSVLRLLLSSIKNREIEIKRPLNDEEVLKVIQSQKKQRLDSIKMYLDSGQTEKADQEKAEISILENYLPAQLTEEELTQVVKSVITELGATKNDFGKVIGLVMTKVGNRASGGDVSSLVKKELL